MFSQRTTNWKDCTESTVTGDVHACVGVSVSCYSYYFQVKGFHREVPWSEWLCLFRAGWQEPWGDAEANGSCSRMDKDPTPEFS